MKAYMIRHGETDWNKIRRLQGQTDIPLNEKGRKLAEETGKVLQKITFDRVISSPLLRALETGMLSSGWSKEEVEIDERIKEIGFGEYEGYSTVNPEYPSPDPDFHLFFDDPGKYHPAPSGETIEHLMQRTGDFLQELAQNDKDQVIMISTHGAAFRAIQANILGLQTKDLWQDGVPKNCAVSILSCTDGIWTIEEKELIYYENI